MFRKQVRCIDCGFLGFGWLAESEDGYLECPLKKRTIIITEGALREPSYLNCARGIWRESDLLNKNVNDRPKVIGEFVNKGRKCPYFFQYHPGYSPAEHRELEREDKTHKLLTRNMLLAAAIGAGAAILARYLAG
jgi:hypothetical protein